MNENKKTQSHFLNLFSLAIADSHVSAEELELLYTIGIENGITREEVDFLVDNPHKVKYTRPETLDDTLEELFDFGRMILADHKVDVREIMVFKSLAMHLDIAENKVENAIEVLIDGLRVNEEKSQLISKIKQILST